VIALLQSLLHWALGALGSYGYLIVFLATLLENVFIVGSFTPGDVITAAAAFTATTPQGASLSPWLLFLSATVGTFIGTNISYFIGLRGGRDLLERIGPRFGIHLDAIEAGEMYFDRHGSQTIILARFIAVLKNLAPALAGASRMKFIWFEVYTVVGAMLYSAILVGVGWFFGANFRAGLKYLGAFSWLGFAVVIVVMALAIFAKRRHDRRMVLRETGLFAAVGDDGDDDSTAEPAVPAADLMDGSDQ
jgi:membrane-associated protein